MSTKPETVSHILEQLTGLPVRAKAMFGEYTLYFDDKTLGLICDDSLFIKKTAFGTSLLGDEHDAPPYPGAKPAIKIPSEKLADAAWIQDFVLKSAAELPAPKKKK